MLSPELDFHVVIDVQTEEPKSDDARETRPKSAPHRESHKRNSQAAPAVASAPIMH